MTYTPERGDIVWVDVRRDGGGAAAERRPGLVLSRRDFNDATGFMLVCPISTRGKAALSSARSRRRQGWGRPAW